MELGPTGDRREPRRGSPPAPPALGEGVLSCVVMTPAFSPSRRMETYHPGIRFRRARAVLACVRGRGSASRGWGRPSSVETRN